MSGQVRYSEHGFEVLEDTYKNTGCLAEAPESIGEEMWPELEYVDISERKYRLFKRAFDIVGASVALIVLLIPFLLVSLIIFADDPGPVFFHQYRVGLKGKRFKIYKFRSMRIHTPKYMSTSQLENPEAYITRVGRVLRKLSIDELPQFFNILIGDMSLVGPRPLISDEYEIHRLRVKYGVYNTRPGITGMAQINGRDTVSAIDKVRYDVEYLKSFGIWTDIQILLATIPKVFSGSGVIVESKTKNLNM